MEKNRWNNDLPELIAETVMTDIKVRNFIMNLIGGTYMESNITVLSNSVYNGLKDELGDGIFILED